MGISNVLKRIQRLFRDFFTKRKFYADFDVLFWLLVPPFFSSFFFLNRLHSCLCPPGLQCARWHSLLQYCTVRQPMHFRKVCPLDCGLLHDEQQMEGEGGDAVVVGAVVVDLPSSSSSILRFLVAFSCPSFAALVHHSRANTFDWSTP